MINRKALWISILLILAMIAANIWRLSLLPDWHHVPVEGPGSHLVPVVWTFIPPLGVLFMMGVLFVRKWLRPGPEEAMPPWRLFGGMALLFVAGIGALAEAFNIARSLGALQSIDRLTLAHAIVVVGGIFMMAAGNILPKMPWLKTRFRPLDPWQWNQYQRFSGRLAFVAGLFVAVGTPLLPFKIAVPVMLGLMLTIVAVSLWYRSKVRREPSPQP